MFRSRQQVQARSSDIQLPNQQPQSPVSSSDALKTFTIRESRPFSPETVANSKADSNSTHSKSKGATRALCTEFQSLKLESMSTGEDYGATSKMLTSALQKEILYSKHYLKNSSVSLTDDNDSDSLSSSSGEEQELTQSMFKDQVKFFCQMKDFLLSQQMSLRHQLEALNTKFTPKPRRVHHHTRSRRRVVTSSNLHIPVPDKTDVMPDPNVQHENLQEFYSCSSAGKSDYFQMCPLCGLELENQENPEALEEHVASHWCSTDPL